MPLKQPKALPKIPKARKKSIEKAKTTIPLKKEDKIEYICKVLFSYDETTKQQFTVFQIRTLVHFSHFTYEITVDSQKERDEIDIVLKGLKAKTNFIPRSSPAVKDVKFDVVYGKNIVNIIKQDGSINSAEFDFNIYQKSIKLIKEFMPQKKNNRHFCKFEVVPEDFTFPEE